MFRACMTFTLMAFFVFGSFSSIAEAKTKKKKTSTSSTSVSSKKKYSKSSSKKNKNKRVAKSRRYRRSGTGPDLRALTTEKPNTEYIENPDNGVNPLETKSEL